MSDARHTRKANRSRISNDPFNSRRIDGKSAYARRAKDLYKSHMAAMGNPADAVPMADALTAAELRTLAEDARSRFLGKDTSITIDSVLKLEGMASRAEKKLRQYKPTRKGNGSSSIGFTSPMEYAARGRDDQ
jgi:hypothetical protein